MKKHKNTSEAAVLRQKAEELLKKKSEAEILEVYQIELKMQNDELILAKEQAESAAEKYRNIFKNIMDAYFEVSLDGTIIEISPSIEIISKGQFTRDELIGKSFAGLYAGSDAFITFFALLLKHGKLTDYELALRNKDGSVVAVSISSMLLYDADGKPAKITGTIRDITDRKQTENALRESEERFRNITRQSGDLISISDANGIITYASPASESIFLISPEEMCGKHFAEFLDEPFVSAALTEFRLVLSKGETTKNLEMRMKRNDGSKFFGELNGSKFQTETLTGTLVTIRDISERKKAEAEKKLIEENTNKQNQRLHAIISTMPDIIFVIGLDGVYQEFYCSTPELLIVPPDKIIGTNLRDVFDEEQTQMHLQKFRECIQSQKLITYEYSFGVKENTGYFEARLAPFGNDRVLTLVRDITQRKHTDNEIRNLNENLESRIIERTIQLEETNKILEKEIQSRVLIEEELELKKQRLEDILRGTNVGTWEWNVQTGATIFNERWFEIIGYSLDELSPVSIETWTKFSHPDDLKTSGELLEKHFKGELDYYSSESRMKHKNGDWVWVLDRGKVHTWDDDGKPLLMSGTHQEITKRKRSEEALRESENRFSMFMDYLPALVFIKDNESRLVYANHAMDEALGASKWIGLSVSEIFGDEEAARIFEDDRKTIQTGYQKIEEHFINLDWKVHHYETQKFVIPIAGQKPMLGGIAIDMTFFLCC